MYHLKGNFIVSTAGIGIGIVSKHLFKKEIIPVSTGKQMLYSWIFLTSVTIVGKMTLDQLIKEKIISMASQGKDKVPNEGFIGPLHGDLKYLMGPQKWDYLPDNK